MKMSKRKLEIKLPNDDDDTLTKPLLGGPKFSIASPKSQCKILSN